MAAASDFGTASRLEAFLVREGRLSGDGVLEVRRQAVAGGPLVQLLCSVCRASQRDISSTCKRIVRKSARTFSCSNDAFSSEIVYAMLMELRFTL
eukprot:12344108-Alexandrium_andersonii.AAC.1